jgi:hypothetical protein
LRAWASSSAIVCSAADTMLRLRRVDHHHAAPGGGVDVDVVEADAGAADHHEVGGRRRAPRR